MRILMILAHPDDEVVFGWPIIQSNDPDINLSKNEVSLLTLSDNHGKRGDGPIKALTAVCRANSVELIDMKRVDSNFYRIPPRYSKPVLPMIVDHFRTTIQEAIRKTRPDFIFTHNPMGEYGHGDHRFVFNLVSTFDIPLMFTDICITNACHLCSNKIPGIFQKYLFTDNGEQQHYLLGTEWYNRMRAVYNHHNAWSWSGHDPIKECSVFVFR
jgi:LmbE family N-acetylglucosaminyl deacetylase